MAEEQKHNIMTAESLKKLQERYDYLLNVKRKEIINAIEIARGFGDLSENAEYTEARNDQAKNEAEITRLKALIENAEVVDESELSTDRVSVGITVRYENTDTGAQSEYGIVGAGADEADPDEGRISSESPIGCPAGQDCRRYCGRGNSARHAAPAHCGHPSLICPIFASDLCAEDFASADATRGHENRRSLRSPP